MTDTIIQVTIPFVKTMVEKYNIDESHGLSHSLDVTRHAIIMMKEELLEEPIQQCVIVLSAMLHDMCDKKYGREKEGLDDIHNFLSQLLTTKETIRLIEAIIQTMSYSKVIVNGFPTFETDWEQKAYHIVREADLLCAYDMNRCITYHLYNVNNNVELAIKNATILLRERVLKHGENGLLTLNYSKKMAILFEPIACKQMKQWNEILASSNI